MTNVELVTRVLDPIVTLTVGGRDVDISAVVERTTFVKLNEVAPTRLRTVFRNVDPATAKQIADECGGDLRVALARSTW